MSSYVYKNEAAMTRMYEFYDRVLTSLNVNYKEQYITTTFGRTHLLILGDPQKKQLITLHGGNGISPLNIRLFAPLLADFCIIAPDVIGMPGKSEPYRNLSTKKNDYGVWIGEVMDAINLAQASFIVSSYSAAMLLSLASISPERIEKAVFLVPSGIAHGPLLPILRKMTVPFLRYYLRPSSKNLQRIVHTMITDCDDAWYEFMDLMMSSYRMELRAPKEFTKLELAGFHAPVLLFASNEDIFFPANQVFPKAKELFSDDLTLLPISGKHLPSKQTMSYVCDKSRAFFLTS